VFDLTDQQIEIWVFGVLLVGMLLLAFYGSRWRRPKDIHTLEEWGVGGRAFGNWVTWFLIGGSSYTAYTFVAVPALVYGVGAIGFYALPFALITTPLTFLVATRVWSVCHAHGFITSAEFARARFGSRTLGLFVAIAGIVATMPYIGVQLIALQAVFKTIGVTGEWPLLVSLGVISITTFRSGLRAPALLSIAKDILLIWLILSAVLVVAMSGGWGSTFQAAGNRFNADTNPVSSLLLSTNGQVSYLTLAIASGLSIFAYPHAMVGILAAKDRATVKRNAAALPAYVLALGLMAMLGFFAISEGVVPVGFDPANGVIGDLNTIMPQTFHKLFPAWSAGIAYATLAVAALIPAAVMSIASANLFTRSIYCEFFRPRASAAEEAKVAQWASLFMKFGAVAFVLLVPTQFSTDLQLIGGVIVLQTLPAVFFGLMTNWFHRGALIAGLIVGLAAGLVMMYQIPQVSGAGKVIREHWGGSSWPLTHLGLDTKITVYVGFVAIIVNLLVVLIGTLVLKVLRVPAGRDATSPADYEADADDDSLDRLDHLLDGLPQTTGAHALRY
jgi:SSS family solute:Na+ symporter